MRPRPIGSLILVLALGACGSGTTTADGKSKNPGAPVTFAAQAGRTGAATIRLEGTRYGSGAIGVVFAHERPRSQDAWAPLAQEAATRGFHALTFNFRGYGVSEGSRAALGLIDLDVEAAVRYLRSAGAAKVILVGGSMGGTASLVAAARVAGDGVVAVSAPATFMGLDAAAAVRRLDVPLAFFAGAKDAPYAADARAMAALRPAAALEIVAGESAHASELLRVERVRKAILDFVGQYGR